MNNSKTYLKNLRISPKKLRFLLPEIKKRRPSDALDYLYYVPKKSGRVFYKALKSAITNAKNTLKTSEDLLDWELLTVEEGQKLKRYRPGGRGTAKSFKIRFSHIKIILKTKSPVKKEEKNKNQILLKTIDNKKKSEKDEKKQILQIKKDKNNKLPIRKKLNKT